MKRRIRNYFGFTLIELLVVISVIGLLAAVALVSLNSAREKALYVRTVGDLSSIAKAAYLYYDARGTYPSDVERDISPGLGQYIAGWPQQYLLLHRGSLPLS